MELIAKFYPHIWSDELVEQVVLTSQVEIKEEIKGFGEAEFLMPIAPGIKEDCKVEIYEANSNVDRLVFRGFVYEINPVWGQFQTIKITARGEKAILHKRKALQDYKFANQSISAIITQLLQIYNTEYHEERDFTIRKDETINELEIGTNDDYYDIFDEICEQKELFREVENGEVIFKKYGRDLRDTQILEFDGLSPNPGNITNIELVGTATGGNIVIVEDTEGKKTIDKSQFSGILTGVVSKQIRKGDDIEKAKQFAKEQARPQRKYQIQVANGSIEAKVGDKIKVEVVNTNSFYDYQGDAMVQNKTITYANASKVVQYGIEEFMVKPFSSETWVEVVEKSIKLLKQKKSGTTTVTTPSVDLSGYATTTAVNQALQSQNTKIEQKADSSFVQGVAQTAQTALNTANQKSPLNHTHTVSQITDFPSSMPASDVYDWAKKSKKPAYTWEELENKPEKFIPTVHHHYIEVNVTTAWNQQHKVGTTAQGNYVPQKGDIFLVNFVHGTVVSRPTLNIDGSGAKTIRAGYYDVGTNMLNLNKTANSNIKVFLWYDGSHYQMFGAGHNSTYGEIPEAEIGDPTKTAGRTISGRRIAKMKEYFEQNVPTPTQDAHAANKAYVDAEIGKLPASSGGADPTAVHLSGEEEITGHKMFKGGLSMRGTDGQYWRGEALKLRKGAGAESRAINGRSDYDGGLLFEYLNDGDYNNFLIRRKGGLHFSYFTNSAELKRRFKLGTRSDHSGIDHGAGGHILQVLRGDMSGDPEGSGNDGGRGIEFGSHGNPYLKMVNNETYLGRTDGHIFPQNWMEMPNHKGLFWNYNTDYAQIYFRSSSNDDSSLDFKLGDDGSEWFRFLFNDEWRTAWKRNKAIFKQVMFIDARQEYGGEPGVSLAIGDSDTGFNRESDGVLSYYSNGTKLQTFHHNAVPVAAENFGHNVKIKKLTQAQYDALGAGRPSNVIYYITD